MEMKYASVYEFVDAMILPYYGVSAARIKSVNWSDRWWAHSEVCLLYTSPSPRD